MAITKETKIIAIEIVGDYKIIQIKEDIVEEHLANREKLNLTIEE